MNRTQRRQLLLYAHFRHRNVSIAAMFLFNWRVYAVILLAAIASIGAMLYLGQCLWAELLAVAYATIFLRDAGQFRRTKRTWPLTRELLDWSKVEEKMAEMRGVEGGNQSVR